MAYNFNNINDTTKRQYIVYNFNIINDTTKRQYAWHKRAKTT